MTIPRTQVDAVEAVLAWINAQPGLSGAGNPLPLGARRWEERSPGQGAYALLVYVGNGPDLGDAVFMTSARVSATVFAGTDAASRVAAIALAELYAASQYAPPQTVVLRDGSSVVIQAIDNIAGPRNLQPATGDWAHLLDATFTITPIP